MGKCYLPRGVSTLCLGVVSFSSHDGDGVSFVIGQLFLSTVPWMFFRYQIMRFVGVSVLSLLERFEELFGFTPTQILHLYITSSDFRLIFK